ncbi:uncharacterized protein LOC132725203 [Ruditapes philippinarum]|uniref:uncharacterized protein LOC132725203 n=1 Tax=Ruditapes philippinarum TaxID=129788 RepID=UPI00295B7A78|nr:uncharacterized protein LOC132725203 [Ruditapes philippinarum]
MKRKLEETDDGFFEKPTKMLPTVPGNYNCREVDSPPGQIGRPVLASTPQGVTFVGTRTTMPGIPASTLQTNSAAENELRHVIDNFVNVYEQLDKNDDPDVKPNYSYSELAYIAMLRSPNFCLPIGQIYSYIQTRFKFFRNSTRKHWKNAVRHSLAKTMCFSKIPVGRGASNKEKLARSTYLWCILPNSIACFARGDYRASIDRETGTNTLRSAYFRMNSEPFWNAIGDYISNKMAHFRRTLEESITPGHIFESQICSFPWKQENSHDENQQPMLRYQDVKNQPRIPVSKHQRNCGLTSNASTPVYLVTQASEMVLPPSQAQISPPSTHAQISHHTQMYHMQTRSSSPALHVRKDQSPNVSTFDHRNTAPNFRDPWLPGMTSSSPESSFICPDLDRGTPPYTSFECTDSGYVDSSVNDNSGNFLNSCAEQNYNRYLTSPPANVPSRDHHFSDNNGEYDFNQFDLSPFSLSDFSDLNETNAHPGFTSDKIRRRSLMSPPSHPIGQPMFISTPLANQTKSSAFECVRRPLLNQVSPPTQCRYMYQPGPQAQSHEHRSTPTPPIMYVNEDGMFSTPLIPHWASYC